MKQEKILCAGFGGQGIITLGKVLANAGMEMDLNVTFFSSYGAEVRGGTANSKVCISDEKIASPMFSEFNTAVIMNEPSLVKFKDNIIKGGLAIINSSLIDKKIDRKDIDVINVPLTEEAIKLGNVRVANIIAAGIYTEKRGVITEDVFGRVIEKMAVGREKLIPINIKALKRGIEIAKELNKES